MGGNMKILVFVMSLIALAMLSGCATDAPTAEFKKAIAESHRLCVIDTASVNVAAAQGITLDDVARQRLENRIKQTIDDKKKTAPCKENVQRDFVLKSTITKYDDGNAFARFMLAGLGQIHIDGDFALTMASKESESIAEFSVSKTFAWGGAYGAGTGIQDVEPAFAEGVADAVVGQLPENKEKK
jgi:hypothetical protein